MAELETSNAELRASNRQLVQQVLLLLLEQDQLTLQPGFCIAVCIQVHGCSAHTFNYSQVQTRDWACLLDCLTTLTMDREDCLYHKLTTGLVQPTTANPCQE